MKEEMKEHVRLLGKEAIALLGASGILGAIGLYQTVAGEAKHHTSVWLWFFLAALVVLAAEGRAVQRSIRARNQVTGELKEAREERDEARHARNEARSRALPRFVGATFRNQRIFIPDLVRDTEGSVVEGRAFINCTLIGPATLVLRRTPLKNSAWAATWDAIWTPVADDKPLTGIVIFDGCYIDHCDFQDVAIAATPKDGEVIRRGFSSLDTTPGRRREDDRGARPELHSDSLAREARSETGEDGEVGVELDTPDSTDSEGK